MAELLFSEWLSYYWLVATYAVGVALAVRAALVARRHRRYLLAVALALLVIVDGAFVAEVAYLRQSISPIALLSAIAQCLLVFALGVEWLRAEDVPVLPKEVLERLLSNGLRASRTWLTPKQYELAVDFIRAEVARTGREPSVEKMRELAAMAKLHDR